MLYKDIIDKNYVATQLIINESSLMHGKSKNKAEINFIIYNDDRIIPIEVKVNDNVKIQSLNVYMKKHSPKYN